MKRDTIADLVKLYDWLYDLGREQEAEALLRLYPYLLDYDVYGNFIGTPPNENGWTA